jgi:hypothetical protein
MLDLAGAGLQVDRALGELGARINVDLLQQGGQFTSLLGSMTQDAIGLGQVLGNLGHAVLNVASSMPGLANVLLSVVDAITRLIASATGMGAFSRDVLYAVFALHELNTWGSIAVAGLSRLIPAAEAASAVSSGSPARPG